MTVSRFQQFPLHQLPHEALWFFAMQLSAREFARLFQVSRQVYALISKVHEQIASNERNHIRIRSEIVPLNAWQTAEQWGQLTSMEARALRMELTRRPFVFYAGVIDPAMVVLRESFFAVRNDPLALSNLALGHLNLRQAAILASQIPNKKLQKTTIHNIVENAIGEYHSANENTILELIARFLNLASKTTTVNVLHKLLLTAMPWAKIEKILEGIPMKKRDEALCALALKEGTEIDKAISIAGLIENPVNRGETLYHIALKNEITPKKVILILTKIVDNDPQFKKLVAKLNAKGFFKNKDPYSNIFNNDGT